MTTVVKQQQLDWRRSKVLELSSQGYSEREVSEVLKVCNSAVHRNLIFIRRRTVENLHIERIPSFEVEKAIAGVDTILRMTSYIANTVTDSRIKIQALSLMNEVYKQKIELTTNCVIVRNALDYVSDKAEKLKVKSESESKESKEPGYGEEEELEEGQEKDTGEIEEEKTADEDIDIEKTHNDIF